MSQLKVRSYLTIRPTQYISPKGGMSPYYIGTIKGINRLGGVVESLGKHLEQVNTLYKFRNEFLIQSQAQRIKLEQKGILLDEKAEKAEEDKNKRWWKRFLDQKNEDESEKSAKKPESVVDAGASVVKKAISPLKKFLQQFSPLFEAFIRFTVVGGILNWITDRKTEDLAKTIGNVIRVFSFVKKLVGFGIGTLLDGLTNLFGGYDKITKGNLAGALQGLLGVGQFLAGVALIKGAQYIMMPWKLITDVGWVIKLFTEWGKINGESEGAARNKDITGYVDKNGNTISKEDFEKAKKSAARNDAKRAKQKGKGWAYSGGQDAVSDRYRSQYAKRKKNFLQRGAQRSRIGLKRATRGVRGQFKAAGNWMQANPAKGNAIFSVVGGLARAGGGLMGGENAGQAVGAGLGQATGGIAGFALGNMLLPGVGGIIGSMIGSVLGEWVGTKLGPIIDPIMKPIGNAFKLGFDIIGTAISPVIETFGEFLGSLVDGLGALFQLCGWLAKAGADVLKFAWDNSIYKKAIDGMIWVWQNKDNIGKAVGEALVQGAKGYLDTLTFNVFDFDKQNKRFAGGRVPFMAAGGLLQTDSPEVMGLKVAGNALLSTIDGALSAFGIVGDITKTTLSSDIGRLSSTFGAGKSVAFGGGRITSQVTRPQGKMSLASSSGDNSRLESIVGTKEVAFLTAQPEQFKPQNDGSIRGLLADIYNGLVSLKILGGDNVVVPSPGGPGGTDAALSAADMKAIQASSADKRAAAHLSTLEASAPQHVADVYQVILNRAAGQSGGIAAVITAKEQFTPYSAAIYGSSADKGAVGKYGKLKVTKKEIFDLASKEDGVQQLTKRFNAGNPSIAAKVLSDFETNGPLSQNAKKFVGGAQYFLGYSHAGARRRPDGGNYFRDKYATGGEVKKRKKSKPGMGEPSSVSFYERIQEKVDAIKLMASGGLLSTNGDVSDLRVGPNTSFRSLRLHHNQPDSHSYNKRQHGAPRDYVIVRDFANQGLDRGSPVVAGMKGKVKYAAGHTVVLQDENGVERMQFHHFDKILVKAGQTVTPSTVLGLQGNKPSGDVHVHLDAAPSYHEKWISAQLNAPRTAEYTSDGDTMTAQTSGGGGASGAQTSLLGSSGEQKDVGTLLEEAFKNWSSAFGGAPAIAAVPTETPNKVSPSKVTQSTSATSTQQAVQTASEQHTSREASKPQGAIATVPMVVPTAAGGAPPAPSVVVNKARPTAMVSQ